MTPPPNVPPQIPRPTPPQLVPPEGRKPKSAIPAIAGIFGIAIVVGLGSALLPRLAGKVVPSGISSNGRSLSRDEAREGVKEMAELTRGARAGDPSTINTSFEPKTELGKNFKAVVLKSQAVEATYAKALGGKTVADLLDARNLTSAAARAATHKRLDDLKVASTKYFADTSEVSQELFRVIAGANGSRIPQAPALEAEIARNGAAMTKLLNTVGETLDFADEAKPSLENGAAAFKTDAQVTRFNELVREYNANAEELQTTAATALRERQKNMSDALRKIDNGAI